MAVAITMQSNGSALHPFFAKSNGTSLPGHESHTQDCGSPPHQIGRTAQLRHEDPPEAPTDGDVDSESEQPVFLDGAADAKKPKTTRKPRSKLGAPSKGQRTLGELLNPGQALAGTPSETSAESIQTIATRNESTESSRRKRRRTSLEEHQDVGDEGESGTSRGVTEMSDYVQRHPSPQVVIPVTAAEAAAAVPPGRSSSLRTPPKKMLKLGAGGKLGSPVTKADGVDSAASVGQRRGRPRKVKEPEVPKSLVVCMRYAKGDGDDATTLRSRVERILSGEDRLPPIIVTPKKRKSPRKPTKPLHPLFSGKPIVVATPAPAKTASPRKTSAITPGKLRTKTMQDRHVEPMKDLPFHMTSALLRDRLLTRQPGVKEAEWPTREMCHTRGFDSCERPERTAATWKRRKRKTVRAALESQDSLLKSFTRDLKPEANAQVRQDGFPEPHVDLRLPSKHLLSGHDVAARISNEIVATLSLDVSPSSSTLQSSQTNVHPALRGMYNRLPGFMSAFDDCKGDQLGWCQKHAPASSYEVLQPAAEMTVLRDWLKSLVINAVDSTPGAAPVLKAEVRPKKKRRRKDDEMDDFLVDSDEEVHESLPFVDDSAPLGGSRHAQSVVQVDLGKSKLSNAVLLSGPHGCGKTAAAYAVARELGFKVFEISSSERRTGRDVLDKIGDLTENHTVQHNTIDAGELSASEDRSIMEAAFQKDLESGRQGKMSAFFTAKPTKTKSAPKTMRAKATTLATIQKALKKPPRGQQQSLILLEEVDILFKDDKDFWVTVLKLMLSSKRPFIMTCNDEELVPSQAMSLHAVLRFRPPPVDLAVDYMLLLAATEGHLLKREAVTSVYQLKQHDLRACITELSLWCQMGVGDPKAGLGWIYQRYPPGSDCDAEGRRLRVISEDTYQLGMGYTETKNAFSEDRRLTACTEHRIPPTAILGWNPHSIGYTADLAAVSYEMSSHSLQQMTTLADALSAIDVFSADEAIDTSLPPLSNKARTHYIEGRELLESNERVPHGDMTNQLVNLATYLAYSTSGHTDLLKNALPTPTILDTVHRSRIAPANVTRRDFAPFDTLANPISSSAIPGTGLEQSIVDGTLSDLAIDVAPYVRSIVRFDLALEEQRNALTGTVATSKRSRTTRAARSALEGSQRSSTRRDRWFDKALDLEGVLATGGRDWPRRMEAATRSGSVESDGRSVMSGVESTQ
ncbi:hypothetical protein B0A48_16545 [Cryoendolithus antarcticus]|uniref:AAA+ ATPase domain-containing protein n=1 Tax=Cryoendolithus antarcticus TaxID=1507870 RepID=A0A1V8SE09_9PEZI|nr:hypothetical protein B0A48_16545 [Cryoendolithus antarcticus]